MFKTLFYVSCRWVLFCASFSYLLIIYKISISNRCRRYFANIESISNRNWNPDIESSLITAYLRKNFSPTITYADAYNTACIVSSIIICKFYNMQINRQHGRLRYGAACNKAWWVLCFSDVRILTPVCWRTLVISAILQHITKQTMMVIMVCRTFISMRDKLLVPLVAAPIVCCWPCSASRDVVAMGTSWLWPAWPDMTMLWRLMV